MRLEVYLVVKHDESIFQALRIQTQVMSRFEMGFQMRVVNIVLISTCAILNAEKALLMTIPAVCKELVVIVEGDTAEFASGMPSEASAFVIICASSWLRIALFYVLLQGFWRI